MTNSRTSSLFGSHSRRQGHSPRPSEGPAPRFRQPHIAPGSQQIASEQPQRGLHQTRIAADFWPTAASIRQHQTTEKFTGRTYIAPDRGRSRQTEPETQAAPHEIHIELQKEPTPSRQHQINTRQEKHQTAPGSKQTEADKSYHQIASDNSGLQQTQTAPHSITQLHRMR